MPDYDRLRKALDAHGAHGRCPSCGNNNWATIDEGAMVQSLGEEDSLIIGRGIPCLVVICNVCGFVRLHAIPILEDEPGPEGRPESDPQTDDQQDASQEPS